jgi:hypothetical protein
VRRAKREIVRHMSITSIQASVPIPRGRIEAEIERRTGVRPSRTTTERWMRRGVRGERLGCRYVGARVYVDPHELDRFLAAVAHGGAATSAA